MRKSKISILIGLAVVIVIAALFSQYESTQGKEKGIPAYVISKPPQSLDQLYPPTAKGPEYLFAMLALERPLSGMMTHIEEGNLEKATEYFEAVRAQYRRMAKMVPEWNHDYWPEKPLDDLSVALESGDMGKVGAAIPGFMQVCVRCHEETMPAVWTRYQMDIGQMREIMFPLSGAFGAVNTYMAEGSFDKASKAMDGFRSLMDDFATTCVNCHDTERTYYIGEDVQAWMDYVADELKKEKPNLEEVAGALQRIGVENCYKCHKVHVPTGSIQRAWAASG